jgi:hypothetical protein
MWTHLKYLRLNFQWYKEFFNLMNFDLLNHSLKIRDSIRTPTPKMGVPLGVCGFLHFQECECDFQVTFPTRTFPFPYFAHGPKAKVWGNFCPSTSGSTRWLCLKAQMLPVKDECECTSKCWIAFIVGIKYFTSYASFTT